MKQFAASLAPFTLSMALSKALADQYASNMSPGNGEGRDIGPRPSRNPFSRRFGHHKSKDLRGTQDSYAGGSADEPDDFGDVYSDGEIDYYDRSENIRGGGGGDDNSVFTKTTSTAKNFDTLSDNGYYRGNDKELGDHLSSRFSKGVGNSTTINPPGGPNYGPKDTFGKGMMTSGSGSGDKAGKSIEDPARGIFNSSNAQHPFTKSIATPGFGPGDKTGNHVEHPPRGTFSSSKAKSIVASGSGPGDKTGNNIGDPSRAPFNSSAHLSGSKSQIPGTSEAMASGVRSHNNPLNGREHEDVRTLGSDSKYQAGVKAGASPATGIRPGNRDFGDSRQARSTSQSDSGSYPSESTDEEADKHPRATPSSRPAQFPGGNRGIVPAVHHKTSPRVGNYPIGSSNSAMNPNGSRSTDNRLGNLLSSMPSHLPGGNSRIGSSLDQKTHKGPGRYSGGLANNAGQPNGSKSADDDTDHYSRRVSTGKPAHLPGGSTRTGSNVDQRITNGAGNYLGGTSNNARNPNGSKSSDGATNDRPGMSAGSRPGYLPGGSHRLGSSVDPKTTNGAGSYRGGAANNAGQSTVRKPTNSYKSGITEGAGGHLGNRFQKGDESRVNGTIAHAAVGDLSGGTSKSAGKQSHDNSRYRIEPTLNFDSNNPRANKGRSAGNRLGGVSGHDTDISSGSKNDQPTPVTTERPAPQSGKVSRSVTENTKGTEIISKLAQVESPTHQLGNILSKGAGDTFHPGNNSDSATSNRTEERPGGDLEKISPKSASNSNSHGNPESDLKATGIGYFVPFPQFGFVCEPTPPKTTMASQSGPEPASRSVNFSETTTQHGADGQTTQGNTQPPADDNNNAALGNNNRHNASNNTDNDNNHHRGDSIPVTQPPPNTRAGAEPPSSENNHPDHPPTSPPGPPPTAIVNIPGNPPFGHPNITIMTQQPFLWYNCPVQAPVGPPCIPMAAPAPAQPAQPMYYYIQPAQQQQQPQPSFPQATQLTSPFWANNGNWLTSPPGQQQAIATAQQPQLYVAEPAWATTYAPAPAPAQPPMYYYVQPQPTGPLVFYQN